MTVHVVRPGLLTTVQDLGRRGYQQYGVSVGGAMDRSAARVANLLVGNSENAAVLEATLHGPSLKFDDYALIAVCGGDLSPAIDGRTVPMWRPILVRIKATITFGAPRTGCRTYLAIAGGFDVPLVLGSRSTHLRAKLSGHEGRALRAGDVLPVGTRSYEALSIMRDLSPVDLARSMAAASYSAESLATPYADHPTVRVVSGSEFDWLAPESQKLLLEAAYEVTNQSDRMGYRLSGTPLALNEPREMFSSPVCAGTIQVPPSGQPIVLTADCATTGGYPRVAHVAAVDLPLVAQARPGSRLRFRKIALEEAHELYRAAEADVQKLKLALKLKGALGS